MLPYIPDLEAYTGAIDTETLGMAPTAVGWLHRTKGFPTGRVPALFAEKLLTFCDAKYLVGSWPRPMLSVLDGAKAPTVLINGLPVNLGRGEIRVIGDDAIYAAPALIYHYVTKHNYLPPQPFVDAVMSGPPAGSTEHRAYVLSLQMMS